MERRGLPPLASWERQGVWGVCPRLYFTCPPPLWGWVASVSETEGGISAMVNGRMMDTLRRRGDSSWHPAISDYARFAGIGRLGQAPSTTSWSPSPIDGGGKVYGDALVNVFWTQNLKN